MNKIIEKKKQKFFALAFLTFMSLLPLKLDANSIHRSSNDLYVFSTYRNVLVSQDPAWIKPLKNVCDAQFADYRNNNGDIVPVLFVAYKDGRAGIFILPVKGENEYSYYEFDEKFEPRKDGVCYIFEGKEADKENRSFIYFRVVDKHGEAVNYAVLEGSF
jgi:hypothetical protein